MQFTRSEPCPARIPDEQVKFSASRVVRRRGIDGCQFAAAREPLVKGAFERADGAIECSDRLARGAGSRAERNTMSRRPVPDVTAERAT
jgi:hypothetical protein